MRKVLTLLIVTATVCGLASGCKSGNGGADNDIVINCFDVSERILTADRYYQAVLGEDTMYLDQYVSLHWPDKFGDGDLKVLHDSLLYYCFNDTSITDPEVAMRHFLRDTSVLTGDGEDVDTLAVENEMRYVVEPVDSLPAGVDAMGCYFNNVMASVVELDEEMVTYQVTSSSYLGGAHPFTSIVPFTYDFATSQVLTVDNMFVPGKAEEVMRIVVKALARQLDVKESGLERAGILVSQLTYPGQPYIRNNMLYFHYNPYEIAPYSFGMIDVAVYPYEVSEILRPEVMKLFDVGV